LRKTLGFNRYASGINLNKFPVENAEAGVGWWDDMRTLTKAIILSDSYMDVDKRQTYFWYPDVSSAERLIRRNHQNSANILCLDGHIEKAQGAELKNNFNITYLY
jgi:prepilin-type processing-associated H-X9-DG protein